LMPDGDIILSGGFTGSGYLNDVYVSTDKGITWALQTPTPNSRWIAREWHTMVQISGTIVLMGGDNGGSESSYRRDVWVSSDKGSTWTPLPSAPWVGRSRHTSVVVSGNIVVIGGYNGYTNLEDVWSSPDVGSTWTCLTSGADWLYYKFDCLGVVVSGNIVIAGGGGSSAKNDAWKSSDGGSTWTCLTSNAAWSIRSGLHGVALSDGSIIMFGGEYVI
jgi:hypothetical protein